MGVFLILSNLSLAGFLGKLSAVLIRGDHPFLAALLLAWAFACAAGAGRFLGAWITLRRP